MKDDFRWLPIAEQVAVLSPSGWLPLGFVAKPLIGIGDVTPEPVNDEIFEGDAA